MIVLKLLHADHQNMHTGPNTNELGSSELDLRSWLFAKENGVGGAGYARTHIKSETSVEKMESHMVGKLQ